VIGCPEPNVARLSFEFQFLIAPIAGDGDAVYVTHVNKGLHAARVVTVR
jgi:hypothetical protein